MDIRNQAKEDIGKFHEKQKLYYNKKNRIKKKFKIEDKVLYYAATKKWWLENWENKWKKVYLIYEEFGNKAYKLKELDRRILKTPQNGEWLKKFYSQEGFTPKIVIKGKEIMDKTRVRFN